MNDEYNEILNDITALKNNMLELKETTDRLTSIVNCIVKLANEYANDKDVDDGK